eukprot:GHVR01185971.1.p1 GENE.GHVR01185971.1~~GHVR01185971.1.p1  ORF type:complete len:225 (-),score=55.18 GHVR01185971.1:90-764(-)
MSNNNTNKDNNKKSNSIGIYGNSGIISNTSVPIQGLVLRSNQEASVGCQQQQQQTTTVRRPPPTRAQLRALYKRRPDPIVKEYRSRSRSRSSNRRRDTRDRVLRPHSNRTSRSDSSRHYDNHGSNRQSIGLSDNVCLRDRNNRDRIYNNNNNSHSDNSTNTFSKRRRCDHRPSVGGHSDSCSHSYSSNSLSSRERERERERVIESPHQVLLGLTILSLSYREAP